MIANDRKRTEQVRKILSDALDRAASEVDGISIEEFANEDEREAAESFIALDAQQPGSQG